MKNRYKIVVICGVTALLSITEVQGGFYDSKMYCIVTDAQVRVTLQKDNNTLCKLYILGYQLQLKKIARDIIYVQAYVDTYEKDREYRLMVRDDLRNKFYTTYNIKKSVQNSMVSFEQQLFNKMQQFMKYYIGAYQNTLENELLLLQKIENKPQIVSDRILLVEQQLITIENIFTATDFQDLLPHVQQYLYLRKQIAGQLAS